LKSLCDRFKAFNLDGQSNSAKPAGLAFDGDVYWGLEAKSFSDDDLDYAQKHLRILSGLYGVLRPMDAIQPYRLEMGTRLKFLNIKDGETRHLMYYAKFGRGLMARWIMQNRVEKAYDKNLSSNKELVFTRPQPPKKK